jgi:hypothetical protein
VHLDVAVVAKGPDEARAEVFDVLPRLRKLDPQQRRSVYYFDGLVVEPDLL